MGEGGRHGGRKRRIKERKGEGNNHVSFGSLLGGKHRGTGMAPDARDPLANSVLEPPILLGPG